nr:unnamed protein product [Callosobruchus analis]
MRRWKKPLRKWNRCLYGLLHEETGSR